jgi:hypothetical protein
MLDKDNFYYKQSNANLKRRLRELSGTKKKKLQIKKRNAGARGAASHRNYPQVHTLLAHSSV